MTTAQIIAALRRYNRWRRGAEDIPPPDPHALGQLIAAAADRLEHFRGAAKMAPKPARKRGRSGPPSVN